MQKWEMKLIEINKNCPDSVPAANQLGITLAILKTTPDRDPVITYGTRD